MANPEVEVGQAIFWPGEVVPINGDYVVVDEQGQFSNDMISLTKGDPFPVEEGHQYCYYFYEPCLNPACRSNERLSRKTHHS